MRKSKNVEPELGPTDRPIPEQLKTLDDLRAFLAAFPEEPSHAYVPWNDPGTVVVVLRNPGKYASASAREVREEFMRRLRALHQRDHFAWTISFH